MRNGYTIYVILNRIFLKMAVAFVPGYSFLSAETVMFHLSFDSSLAFVLQLCWVHLKTFLLCVQTPDLRPNCKEKLGKHWFEGCPFGFCCYPLVAQTYNAPKHGCITLPGAWFSLICWILAFHALHSSSLYPVLTPLTPLAWIYFNFFLICFPAPCCCPLILCPHILQPLLNTVYRF